MKEYYKREYFVEAKAQRIKTIIGLCSIIGIYLLISAGVYFWYSTLPYESPKITLVKIVHYSLTFLFVMATVVFARIKFKRVDSFYKKCIDIETGLTEENFGNFLEFDESLHTKDGVDFKTAVFVQYRESKKDFFERRVLIFYEKPNPEFIEGQNVRYITQGNVLKSYEIVKEGDDKWEQ